MCVYIKVVSILSYVFDSTFNVWICVNMLLWVVYTQLIVPSFYECFNQLERNFNEIKSFS